MYNVKIDKSKLEDFGKSHIRVNREYLLNSTVASDLNTYLSFSPFDAFVDMYDEETRAKMARGEVKDPKVGYPGVRSIFNKSGAVLLGKGAKTALDMSEWRASNNVPLIDSPEHRKKIRENSGYTIKELVEASQAGILGSAIYSYSDFMYCKYLGQMPNNYLVTLRRYPTPVDDYISAAGLGNTRKINDKENGTRSTNPVPIGELVTWLNTPGNNLDEILSYSVSMPFEEKTAKWEDSSNADASQKPLNALAATFDKTYRQQYQAGQAGGAINGYVTKLFGKLNDIDPPYTGMLTFRDQNKVYGPVDAVKKVYKRSDDGINFTHSFDLTFEYELRSYNGINGRQAMLDLISNILNVTYTTGTFWGGGYAFGGAHQSNIFSNLNIMKTNGGFSSFVDAFFQDASNIYQGAKKSVKEQGGPLQAIKNFLNDLGGMLAGAWLNKLGRPDKAMVNSLLSPAPVGLWHVTIGNPFHPIMSMGNMILKNTTITHTGPLGLDDFPTGLKVVCQLERGKPRDLREIEMLYMNGNDRIYHGMGPYVFEIYNHAKGYKSSNRGKKHPETPDEVQLTPEQVRENNKKGEKAKALMEDLRTDAVAVGDDLKRTFVKWFGTDGIISIYVQAAEQERGAWKKKKQDNNGPKNKQQNLSSA